LLKENHTLNNREQHIHYIDTINDTVKSKIDTVNDTVFNLIKQNNRITATEISDTLKISLSTSKRRIKALKEQGKIERVGSDKKGYWRVIE
jgi:predicted HTH transcriptional regulator